MRLERVDVRDPAAFASWFDTLDRSDRERRGAGDEGWRPSEWRARALGDGAAKCWHLLADVSTLPRPLAVAAIEVTALDNLGWARAELHVHPEHRRHGHGTAALADLERYALALSRRVVVVATEGAGEFRAAPNRFFAPRRGYELVEESLRLELPWPQQPEALDAMEADLLGRSADYEVRATVGPGPDAWSESRARLMGSMPLEAPHADVGVTEEVWDESRVREHEATIAEMGRQLLLAVAVHRRSGRLVGFSELTVSFDQPARAYQWDTIVERDHRGHHLGGLMKVANLRHLGELGWPVPAVATSTSVHNSWMIDVNERMGFERRGGTATWARTSGVL